ncbi:MAG: PhzF family phenazine biosynthesis protein [Candidatus Heimdallarchaeota archaeon]
MRKHRFFHVDVFTETRFGGNQLAVFVDGQSLSAEEMQKIACEMNFSETTFVLPPESPEADWKVRIFTPGRELPFAGHPTLGTAYVLAQEGMVGLKEPQTAMKLELGIGIVPVELEVTNQKIWFLQMEQQQPTFGQRLNQIARIAEALAIDVHEVEATGLPVEVVSCGLPFLYVPVKSLRALENMKPNLSLLEDLCAKMEATGVFVFSRETVHLEPTTSSSIVPGKDLPDLRVHSRMFAPGVGVHEDPATGSASGPLGCYLVKNGVVPFKSKIKIISEQGYEIRRPSTLYIEIGMTTNNITDVRVGGYVVLVVEGTLFID